MGDYGFPGAAEFGGSDFPDGPPETDDPRLAVLRDLEDRFHAAGGRGVELAEEIDRLRKDIHDTSAQPAHQQRNPRDTPMVFDLYCETVTGEYEALKIAGDLVRSSQWFMVTPLPDDQWRFDVRAENHDLIKAIVAKHKTATPPGTTT